MPNYQRIVAMGHAGRDGELKYTTGGAPKLEFSLAVSDGYRDKAGEWKSETEWMNVVAWGDMAERIAQRVVKGAPVFIEGKLKTRTWDDNEGKKHYRTEVIANTVQVLTKDESAGAGGQQQPSNRRAAAAPRQTGRQQRDVDVDDLPFE